MTNLPVHVTVLPLMLFVQDLKETVTHEEMEQLLSIVQVVPLTEFDAQLTPLLNQRVKWFEVVARYVHWYSKW